MVHFQRLTADLAAAAATEERREDAIEQLQRRLAKQDRKLYHINSAIRRLQQNSGSVTGQTGTRLVNSSRRRGGDMSTTPRPFISKYPAGESAKSVIFYFNRLKLFHDFPPWLQLNYAVLISPSFHI